MEENNKNGAIALKTLLEKDGSIEVITSGGVEITVTLDLLRKLTSVKSGDREPNTSELLMFGNMCVEHRANPYLKECWLVYITGVYQPIIAAQVRLRKAQSMTDYDGYEWGWITKEGEREELGHRGRAMPNEIVGVWGQVKRKNISVPFYHETFKSEYAKPSKSGKGIWDERPVTMILKVNRDQTHKFAYADQMGNLCTEYELIAPPEPSHDPTVPKRDERKVVEGETKDIPGDQDNKLLEEALTGLYKLYLKAGGEDDVEKFCELVVKVCGGKVEDYIVFDDEMNKTLNTDVITVYMLSNIKEHIDNEGLGTKKKAVRAKKEKDADSGGQKPSAEVGDLPFSGVEDGTGGDNGAGDSA